MICLVILIYFISQIILFLTKSSFMNCFFNIKCLKFFTYYNFEKNALAFLIFFSKLISTMNTFDVFFHVVISGSPVVTMRTSKRFFSSMSPHVSVQTHLLMKSFTTFFTFVVSYSCNLDQNNLFTF